MQTINQQYFRQHLPNLEVRLDEASLETYGRDWTHLRAPAPSAVLFPRNTEQVSELILRARTDGFALVPSGGRTGLSGGAVAAKGEWVVSMEKCRSLADINLAEGCVEADAGVITATVQQAASQADLFYGVDFASAGSSQIGGNIATNAGGIRVLRYGLTREQVLGLTVVTGSGEVLELNQGLIKNATGYDLRHLFIGSEGTLGVITKATLKLWPNPPLRDVMLVGLGDHQVVMPLFAAARAQMNLSAFEFFSHACVEQVCMHAGISPPLDDFSPYYALLEFDQLPEAELMVWFEQAMEMGWVTDGVISQSDEQARQLWAYRERISESIAPQKPYKNDIAVRISAVPELLEELDELVKRQYPDFQVLWYGHIGDGNLHLNVLKPEPMELSAFKAQCEQVNELVFAAVQKYAGSISAEHGVGLLKQPWLTYSRSQQEIALMRAVKQQFDPGGILNPGKLI